MDYTGVVLVIISVLITAIITSLVNSFFSHKSTDKKLVFVEGKIHTISKDKAKVAVDHHEEVKHQDSLYEYVESQMKEHKKDCGQHLGHTIAKLETGMQKMEIRQVKMSTKMSIVMTTMTEIAKQLKVTVDLTTLDHGDDS